MKKLTLLILLTAFTTYGAFAVTYFLQSTTNLHVASNWNTASDGTGTAASNFAGVGDIFTIDDEIGTVTIGANWVVAGAVQVGAGFNAVTFSTNGFTISGTFNVSFNATLDVNTNSAFTLGTCTSTSTVRYSGDLDQSIRTGTYYNLVLTGATTARTKTASGNITVNNDLTVNTNNTLVMAANVLSGTIFNAVGSGIITTTNTSANPLPNGVIWTPAVQFNGGAAHAIPNGTYANLLVGGTNDIKTANGNIVVSGVLNVTSGNTLAMGTNSLSGSFTNSGTGNISTTAATAAIPSGKTWTQTINYAFAGAQEVVAGTYAGFTTSGSGVKTALGNLIVNGTITVGANTTLNLSTFELSGSLPTITFGSTTTSILQTANTTSTPIPSTKTWGGVVQYNSTSAQTVVNGIYNSINLSGGDRTISTSDTLFVNGTFTSGSGNITTTGSTVIFQGTAATQTISLAGQTSIAFNNIRLRGGANKTFSGTAADITVNGELNIYGGVSMNLGTHRLLFGGGISLQGNGRLNSAHLVNTNPIPTIVGVWPYRVTFSGTNMSVSPGIYDTLTISGNGIKTAQGNITVNDSLIIGATNSTLDMATFELLGAFTPGGAAGTIRTQNTGATPLPSGLSWDYTVNYNAPSNQTVVSALRYRSLTINGGSGEKTTAANVKVNLTLTVTAGVTFNLATFSLDSVTTITNAGTIRTQNTSSDPIPSGKIIAGTFLYDGVGAQNVVKGSYTNLNITGGNRTLTGDTINVSGLFTAGAGTTINGGASIFRLSGGTQTIALGATGAFNDFYVLGGTKTITAATGPLTVDGILDIAITRTLALNDNQLLGTFTNSGLGTITTTRLTGAVASGKTWTSLVNYSGAANQEIIGGTYNRLTLSGTGPKLAAGNIVVDSALVSGALAIDMVTFSLSGSLLTITGTGVFSTQCLTNAVPAGLTWPYTTFNYNSTVSAQDVIPGTYLALNISGGNRFLAGVVNVSGAFTSISGSILADFSSEINLTGATTQTITLGSTGAFNDFRITNGTTKTVAGGSGTLTIEGALEVVSTATLVMGTNQLAGTITEGTAGTGIITTTSTASPAIPSGITWIPQVSFIGNSVGQFIPAGSYTVLNQSTGTDILTALGNITILSSGVLSIQANQTFDLGTNQLVFGGTATIVGTGTIRTQNTSATPIPSAQTWTQTILYNSASAQEVVSGTYVSLNVNGGDRTFNGIISISGVFTANSTAVYTTTGSTIGLSGAAQTPALLSGFTFDNLACTGTGTKTFGVPITVNGQLTIFSGVIMSIGTQTLSGTFTTAGTGQLNTTVTGGPAIPTGKTWSFIVGFTANANQNIPDGIYQGGLTLGGTGTRTKTMQADITVGGLLNTGTGHFLALNGNQLTLDGEIDGTATGFIRGNATSEIIIANNANDAGNLLMDQTTPGTTNTVLNFTLSRNTGADAVIIGNTLRVLNLVTITDGTLNGNGNLVFVSSSETQSAQLAPVSGSGAVSGDFVVQRFIPGNSDRDWRFVASSVTTTNNISNNWQLQTFITGSGTGASSCPGVHTNGFDYTSNNATSLVFWNTSSQAWNSVASTNSTNLVAGTGYRFYYRGTRSQGCAALTGAGPAPADTTLIATGTLLTGTQNITCATGTGWTLVGNPYQANINLDLVGRTNVGPIYYVYDPSFNNYRQYDVASGIGTGAFLGNGVLAPGQAIFVVSTGVGASITFNESNKVVAATPAAMFKQSAKSEILRIKLETENNEIDQSLVAFNENSSWAKDINDGPLFDETLSQIATYTDATSVPMGINKINYLSRGEFKTIYVDLSRALESNKTYKLILTDVSTFAPGYKLSLVDMYTNKTVALNDDMAYTINTDENPDSKSSTRIQIKVENINGKTPTAAASVLSTSLSTKGDVVLYPQPANEVLNLTIQSGNSQVKHILVQDITGRSFEVTYELANTRDVAVDVSALPTGVYFITLQGETEKVTYKFIKQ
jgi:hypothetical protein